MVKVCLTAVMLEGVELSVLVAVKLRDDDDVSACTDVSAPFAVVTFTSSSSPISLLLSSVVLKSSAAVDVPTVVVVDS